MSYLKILAAALVGAAACAGGSPAAGKWSCTNLSSTGASSPWTLLIQENDGKLAGSMTDGDVKIPLSEMKLDGGALTFKFYINEKPYGFVGIVGGAKLEGTTAGRRRTASFSAPGRRNSRNQCAGTAFNLWVNSHSGNSGSA